ncbi:MAG: TonB-dependent receptor [Gammaproteobacteria bacterium]|nr:TonB-dependent receptor [Gammaproteobacteria bacterium]MBU0786230.1 TonB-dependent receptor [Gammaproteobacteria bacterium]MBU0814549.1 TonB-dependent receptor [Gammaproteobacteria bacterium]MBU1786608.1 TonB-dependent receptor [Gammaproteobacteria bacterium]
MKISRFRAHLLALPLVLAPFSCAYSQTSGAGVVLKETLVTATRFADTASDLPFGVSVISSEEIKRSGAATVNEAIMKLLGVPGRQDYYGGGNYALDLRGFGTTSDSNQVVIVDGLKMNEADLGGTRLAGIPVDSVERIEIIRGSGAVLYGEGATGGVIVITTKAGRGVARKNAAEIYTAAGSLGLREARASGTVTAGGFSLDLAANRREADNHRDNFKSDGDGGSVTGQWSNEWLRLGARYARDELQTGLPGSLTAAQYAANPQQTTSPNNNANIKNARQGVFAEAAVGNWQLAMDAGTRSKSLNSYSPTWLTKYDIDANSVAMRARNEQKLGDVKNVFITGVDVADWTRNDLGSSKGVRKQENQGLYLKNDVTLAGGTRLSAGWRTDQVKKSMSTATTRIDEHPQAWDMGVSYPVLAGVALYGRIGQSYRLANVDEIGSTRTNEFLRPQTSRDTEFGARMKRDAAQLDVRLYRSDLTDELAYDGNAKGAGSGANVNLDPTLRQGLELEGRYALSAAVNLRLNAALREARFVSGSYAGNRVPLVPAKTLALRADWSPALGHRLDGGVNWVATQNPDMANLCTMPAYTTMDMRYSYQYKNAELALGLNNLTDNKYYTQAFSCSAGVTSSIYPEAGRTLVASMRLRF